MDIEFVDEERIPLLHNEDEYEDPQEDLQEDTSFGGVPTPVGADIQREATQVKLHQMERNIEKMDKEINALERNFNIEINKEERKKFRYSGDILQVERSPGKYVSLTKSNGEFYSASTLRSRLGAVLARSLLGIETPKVVKTRSRLLLDMVPTELEMEELTPDKIEEVNDRLTAQLREIGVNTDLDMREFDGIDDALTRIKGEYANNLSKLSKIDEHIKRDSDKLAEVEGDESVSDVIRQRIRDRIADLKEERSARLELVSHNKKELASQYARITQTVEKILDGDLTLREKIRLVFREHGLTITAVLTSLGLVISTVIGFLTGGSSGGSPPKHPNKLKEWVKGRLKALARVLGRLAGKAVAALPGILGSIVAGILNFIKKAVVAASQHVWLFLTSIATLISYRILYPPSRAARR